MKKKTKTINIAPKWMTVYPIYKNMILRGTTTEKEFVCSELKRLCEAVDEFKEVNNIK